MVSNPNVPTRTPVKFKTLVHDDAGPKSPVTEVLDDQQELDTYSASCQAQGFNQPVAFPDEVAVAIALGSKPTAGYDVQIVGVIRETGGFIGIQHYVLYVVTEPHGQGAAVMTYPHHVIRVRGLHGIVHFRRIPDSLGPLLSQLHGGTQSAAPSTLAVGEEGSPPTTLAVGEEQVTSPIPGKLTTLLMGEEGPTTFFGEHVTTVWSPWEEHVTTMHFGEEGWPSDPRVEDPFGGQGSGGGPFG